MVCLESWIGGCFGDLKFKKRATDKGSEIRLWLCGVGPQVVVLEVDLPRQVRRFKF